MDIILFALVMAIAIIATRAVTSLIRRHLDDTVGKRSSKGVARILQYGILGITFLVATSTFLHIDLNAVLLSLGIVGIAVAFATQQIIQNAVSGILISLTKPIQLEDWVEVGGGPSTGICRVRDIRLLSTELREKEGRITIIPNSQIINGKVINYTRSGFTALIKDIWVGPVSDLEKIRQIVLEVADEDPYILPYVSKCEKVRIPSLFDHSTIPSQQEHEQAIEESLVPIVNVADIQGSRIKLEVKIYVRDVQRNDEIMSGFLEVLKARFEAEGIELRDP